ncbi:hypothetical protein HMN09_00921000 [Mycena chlorophos]|uniref:Uncharacterized protein n=1 Tax=Mycena chlorophos TaxID=658473 RepID=A0A8H6W0D7_MYCCL|nr:hypothetical protein HMN09_00921000 [Mycena chlorophos]
MDIDPPAIAQTAPDEAEQQPSRRRTRRHPDEHQKVVIRGVPGPARIVHNELRRSETHAKEKVVQAKRQVADLAAENNQLRAELEAARQAALQQSQLVGELQQEVAKKGQAILAMQEQDVEMEAQILGDQQKIDALQSQVGAITQMVPQLLQAQQQLDQRNGEVQSLNNLVFEKNNEIIQLRSNVRDSQAQSQTRAPRCGTRASLGVAHNINKRLLQIPLDPAPFDAAPLDAAPSNANEPDAPPMFAGSSDLGRILGARDESVKRLMHMFERIALSGDEIALDFLTLSTSFLRDTVYANFEEKQVTDFMEHIPASKAAIEAGPPEPDVFQWDFGDHYLKSEWNDHMMSKIIDLAIECDEDDRNLIQKYKINRDYLRAIMVDKLQSYRANWTLDKPRSINGRMETVEEAQERAANTIEQHQLAAKSTAAKKRKYDNRLETIVTTIEIKAQSKAPDLETWKTLLKIVKRLGSTGMSSEEEDEVEVDDKKITVYRVKICVWRAPEVVGYLGFADKQHALFKTTSRGAHATPRIRESPAKRGVADAPRRLPKALYNEKWLKKQTPSFLKELKFSVMACVTASQCPTFPQGSSYFDGFVRNKLGIFAVHYGDPEMILNLPNPNEASPPPASGLLWINPSQPYLVVLPRSTPFHGPIFSCLNVSEKHLPIEAVDLTSSAVDLPVERQTRYGLGKTLIKEWKRLEWVLRRTLDVLVSFNDGFMAPGVSFTHLPFTHRYADRDAHTAEEAVRLAMEGRDAFLPLMAQVTMLWMILDAKFSHKWKPKLRQQTEIPWQWLDDLESSAVADMQTERVGGIVDLTSCRDNPNHRLLRHADWLYEIVLAKHRVPLYFYFGSQLPLQEPIPDALLSRNFLPTPAEAQLLQHLEGPVAFSPWTIDGDVWCRCEASSSSPVAPVFPSPQPAIASDFSGRPIVVDPLEDRAIPKPEQNSGQLHGETFEDFFARRRLRNLEREAAESPAKKTARLAEEAKLVEAQQPPSKNGKNQPLVYIWDLEDGFFIRRLYGRTLARDRWEDFTPNQRRYNSFHRQWDLCEGFAPNESAEPDDYDDYDDDDDDYMGGPPQSIYQEAMPTIDDGATAEVYFKEILEEAHGSGDVEGLTREELLDEALPGYNAVRVTDILVDRFGYRMGAAVASNEVGVTDTVFCGVIGQPKWSPSEREKTIGIPILFKHFLNSELEMDWSVEIKVSSAPQRGTPPIKLRSPATVLQVIRSGWGFNGDTNQVIRNLVKLGCEFYLCWDEPRNHKVLIPRSLRGLGTRPLDYKGTPTEYNAYTQVRNSFLHSSRGRFALNEGGIVARIARSVLGDCEDVACEMPMDEDLNYALDFPQKDGRCKWFEKLTQSELNVVVGMYAVATGQHDHSTEDGEQRTLVSWWPGPAVFFPSSHNTGYWPQMAEDWYAERLKQIADGSAKLFSQREWKGKMKLNRKARAVNDAVDTVSEEYLVASSRVLEF